MSGPVRVAVAVVESDGHVLVGVRGNGQSLSGLNEFPGGKCLFDETTRAAAVRECREETGLIVIPRRHLATTTHTYDHDEVELDFWHCCLSPDLPGLARPHEPFRWVPVAELHTLEFPAGNQDALRRLQERHGA